jgi:hypothetical protein
MFAAQVGSTTDGASVYAGALPDRRLGHGAIVFTSRGSAHQTVTFQEFFALGTITGRGSVTLVKHRNGSATFTGSFEISGGSGKYAHAHGSLSANGTLTRSRKAQATLTGSFIP